MLGKMWNAENVNLPICVLIVHGILTLLHKWACVNNMCYKLCPMPNAFLLQYLHFPHFWPAFYHSADCDKSLCIYRCGNMRKDSSYVVCCFDQSASFRTLDSAFHFLHSAFRNSAFYPHPQALAHDVYYNFIEGKSHECKKVNNFQ